MSGVEGPGDPDLIAGLDARQVMDLLPSAVVVTDPSGQIVLWNLAAERLYGWTRVEVIGKSIVDVLAPLSALGENKKRLEAVAGGKWFAGERTVVGRDGRLLRVATFTRPVRDGTGKVVAIAGISEDVTSLRLAEEQARGLTDHLRLALQAGGLGTWRWTVATGEMVFDERLEALHGLPPGGFDGTFAMFVSLLHPDDREAVLVSFTDGVETGPRYQVEYRVLWPDGSVRWLAGAGAATVDEHGDFTGTVGCLGDATDRVSQEAELRRLAALAADLADLERRQRERLEFVGTINDALNESTTAREALVNVTSRAVPRLGDWCSIHLVTEGPAAVPEVVIAHVDPEMVAYAYQLQERFPYDPDAPTGVAFVIRTGQTVFYPEINDDVISQLDATDEEREIIAQLALRSAIAVPLVKQGRILGAIQFVLSTSDRRYTEEDVALATAVAGRIASSLENHRLNQRQREIAKTLQRSLLPAALPDIPGVELAVRYWAGGEGTEVGGDFYDVFSLESANNWALVMGDVCGTGPEAAALTALARYSIRDSAWHGDSPEQVLSSLNRAVNRSTAGTFVTAVYATLDISSAAPTLTTTSAGHPLPVHVTPYSAAPLGHPGTLLGVLEVGKFLPATINLAAGDVVVFYTDGATDLPPPYGIDQTQFTDLVASAVTSHTTAEEVADRIHDALDNIVPFSRRNDDIALLIMRILPDE